MSHSKIPEFTETEPWTVRTTLKERYGREIEWRFADSEILLGGADGMAWCPTLFRCAKGANFAIVESGAKRYRAYFYYRPEHQLGTGIESYDEIGDRVTSALRVESDHMRRQKISTDQHAAKHGDATPGKPDTSPLFWGDRNHGKE